MHRCVSHPHHVALGWSIIYHILLKCMLSLSWLYVPGCPLRYPTIAQVARARPMSLLLEEAEKRFEARQGGQLKGGYSSSLRMMVLMYLYKSCKII
jgi:hypothetical protein